MSAAALVRSISSLPAGTAFSRYLKGLTLSAFQRNEFLDVECRSTPQVRTAFDWETKAATAPGTSSDSAWAGPLAASGLLNDVRPLLERVSLYDALGSRFTPVPFNMKIPIESTVPTGGWVTENLSGPVVAVAFGTVAALPPTKAVAIAAMTKELVMHGAPSTEAFVRSAVLSGQGKFLGQQLLDPAVTATTARPASITNTGVAVTTTGSTAAAIAADLTSMVAAVTTRLSGPVWLMRPRTMSKIAGELGAGAPDLPRTLRGFPVITHPDSPAQITLIDAPEILVADGGIDVDTSGDASVQMNDAPDNPPTAATVMTSFFQTNLIGFRVLRPIYWVAARTGAVAFMTVSY